MSDAADHVAKLVRDADHDRYLATLYAPSEKRRALLALFAFNAEIASIRDRVREAMPGEIRIQWWRDALQSHDVGDASGNPLLTELRDAIERYRLPHRVFDAYLEARIFDLYNDPMPSRIDLEGYAGETASALLQLAALILDAESAPRFAEAAGHGGCAQAIAGILLLSGLHRARGQCFVPLNALAAAGSSAEAWLDGANTSSNRAAFSAMIALARDHLAKFQASARNLSPSLRPAFLPLALTPAYLDTLEAAGFPATSTRLSGVRRHWLLLRRATTGWR